jgi:ribosomal protein S18 acetylase RimI-like enzyme
VSDARDLRLEISSEPSVEDVHFLDDRIYDFNVEATGIDDGRWLAIFVRDAAGAIVAGLHGHTWGETCEIRTVWVDASLRGRGLGRRLLAAAEAEAVRRACRQIVLATHSFQAPEFYRKLGFEVLAAVDEYPRGHRNLTLRKRLSAAD